MHTSSDQLRKPLYQAGGSEIFLQQMSHKQKQYQIHTHNKNQEDFDHIQMTSPTQNLVTDESIFYQQDRKKCLNCIHNQKRLSQMDHELNHEKKKNLKFLKIINAKVEKEKQLQHAYRHIAKQLKKRIDDAINNEVHELVSNQQKRQNQEINAINIKLLQAQEQLRHKMQTIRRQNEKTNSLWSNSSIIKAEQKKFSKSLDPMVNNIKVQPTTVKSRANLNIYHCPISVHSIIALQQQFEDVKEDPNIGEEQTSQQKYLNKRKSQKDQQMVEDYIFQKQNSSKNYSQLELKHVQSNKAPRRSQSFQQFKTVIQGQEQNSFRSIQTSRLSDKFLQSLSVIDPSNVNEQQSKSHKQKQSYYTIHQGGLQISQISNVSFSKEQPNRASEKQMLDHFMSYSNQIIEQKNIDTPINRCQSLATQNKISTQMSIYNQLNAQRQKINRFTQCIQYFFERLSARLNFYGQKYKTTIQIPKQLLLFADSSKNKSNHQIHIIDNEKIQEILKFTLQQIQQNFKNQKKQSDKTVNDQLLYISDIQNKYNDLINRNKCLEKTIEGYQIHKSFMEIKILELQEKQINSNQETKKFSEMKSKFPRKVSIFKLQNTKNQQSQCSIVPSDIVKTMQHLSQRNAQFANVLSIVPNILNELSPEDTKGQYALNFQENIKDQIEAMLKDSIEMILTKQQSSLQNEDMLKRVRSASYCNKLSFRECSQSINSLETQNQQLKCSLKQKGDEILNFSSKITLQNMEIANNHQLIENLKIEIYQLKKQVKAKERNNSQSKVDHFQSISPQPTPTKQNRSQSGLFLEYDDKKQYNNLYYDRDQQVKHLKQKLLYCQGELNKYRLQHKKNKKKIIYINN